MRISNVLLAAKKTELEFYVQGKHESKQMLAPEDLVILEESYRSHYATLHHIKDILDCARIPYQEVYAYCAPHSAFQGRDLIISAGGDGTLLYVAHHVLDSTPVMPIKSDSKSRGALCTLEKNEFASVLEKIQRDEMRVAKWTRIEGTMGGHRDLALNEVLVGPRFRPQQARYEICLDGVCEQQAGSGLIITTGSGSTGWYINIAGNEGKFPRTEESLRFIATEYRVDVNYRLVKGRLGKGQTLHVRSAMNNSGIVSFDGDTESRIYPFFRGQTLEIRISDLPLHVILP